MFLILLLPERILYPTVRLLANGPYSIFFFVFPSSIFGSVLPTDHTIEYFAFLFILTRRRPSRFFEHLVCL